SPARLEAGAHVLADLLDLRPHIALADNISDLVACDLTGNNDPMPAITHCDDRGGRRSGTGWSNPDRPRLPARVLEPAAVLASRGCGSLKASQAAVAWGSQMLWLWPTVVPEAGAEQPASDAMSEGFTGTGAAAGRFIPRSPGTRRKTCSWPWIGRRM